MEVKLVGRGSNDVLGDKRKQVNMENTIKEIKCNSITNNSYRIEYGYNDKDYIRFIYEGITKNKIGIKNGAFFIVFRIEKIIGLCKFSRMSNLFDMCTNELIDTLALHLETVIHQPDNFDQVRLDIFEMLIREMCDILEVDNTTRIEGIINIIRELF